MNVPGAYRTEEFSDIVLRFDAAAFETKSKLSKASHKINFVSNFCAFLQGTCIEIDKVSVEKFKEIASKNQAQGIDDCKIIGAAFKQFKHSLTSRINLEGIKLLLSYESNFKFSTRCGDGYGEEFVRYGELYDRFVKSIYKITNRVDKDAFLERQAENRKRKEFFEHRSQAASSQPLTTKRARIEIDLEQWEETEDKGNEKEADAPVQRSWVNSRNLDIVGQHKTPCAVNKIIAAAGNAIFSSLKDHYVYCWNSTILRRELPNLDVSSFESEFKKIIDFDVGQKFASVVIDPTNPLVYKKNSTAINLKNWQPFNRQFSFSSPITNVKIFESYIAFGFSNGEVVVTDLENGEEKISFKKRLCDIYYPDKDKKTMEAFPLNNRVYSIDINNELLAASGSSKEAAVASLNGASVSVFRGYGTMVKVNVLFEGKLFTASKKEVLIWDLNNFKNIYKQMFALKDQEIQAIIPDARGYYRLLTKSNAVEYFDLSVGRTVSCFDLQVPNSQGTISSIEKDDNDLYVGYQDGSLFKTSDKKSL